MTRPQASGLLTALSVSRESSSSKSFPAEQPQRMKRTGETGTEGRGQRATLSAGSGDTPGRGAGWGVLCAGRRGRTSHLTPRGGSEAPGERRRGSSGHLRVAGALGELPSHVTRSHAASTQRDHSDPVSSPVKLGRRPWPDSTAHDRVPSAWDSTWQRTEENRANDGHAGSAPRPAWCPRSRNPKQVFFSASPLLHQPGWEVPGAAPDDGAHRGRGTGKGAGSLAPGRGRVLERRPRAPRPAVLRPYSAGRKVRTGDLPRGSGFALASSWGEKWEAERNTRAVSVLTYCGSKRTQNPNSFLLLLLRCSPLSLLP